MAIPSIFISFIFPLELGEHIIYMGEHIIYGWTNKRYIKGTFYDRIYDLFSVGRLPKDKGIDK